MSAAEVRQKASKTEIMKGVVENEEIIQELEVKSYEKGKTKQITNKEKLKQKSLK